MLGRRSNEAQNLLANMPPSGILATMQHYLRYRRLNDQGRRSLGPFVPMRSWWLDLHARALAREASIPRDILSMSGDEL